MQPIWSGVIGFGLVNIPVKLYSPAKEEILDLDFLHKKDRSTIRYARVCRFEEKEVPWEDIVRGYKLGEQYVVLDDEDLKKANARKTSTIDIQHFANEEEIDSIYFEKPYYLEPDKKSQKAYVLLREALKKTGTVGIATVVLRHKEILVALKADGNVLVLNQLRYWSEVKPSSELNLPKTISVSNKELKIATELIQKSTEPFKPKAHKDRYMEEMKELIKEKAKGKKPKKRGHAPAPTKVDDLMKALKQSLETGKTVR